MRKLLALVTLLFGAANALAAEPQKWCFESSELVMTNPPVIKTPGKADEQFDEFWPEQLIHATVSYSDDTNGSAKIPVMLYGDRVFGPCEQSE